MLKNVSSHIFYLVVSSLVLSFLPSLTQAGAWPREKNETYSKISLSQFKADQIYGPKKNKKLASPDFTDNTLSLYSEYGFTSDWTGIASLDYKSMESKDHGSTSSESGFGDAWLHLKRGLLRTPFVLSTQVGIKLPLGYNENHTPPLGEGQIDLEARLLMGRSFKLGPPGYGNAEIAYRKRNGDFSDVIPYRLETGVWVSKPILFKLSLDGVSNLSNDVASNLQSNSTDNVFDQEYLKFSPALIFFLKRGFSIDVYYETTIAGANASVGKSVGIGLAWQGKVR